MRLDEINLIDAQDFTEILDLCSYLFGNNVHLFMRREDDKTLRRKCDDYVPAKILL